MKYLKIFALAMLGSYLLGLPVLAQDATNTTKCVIRANGRKKVLRFSGGSITGFNDSDAAGTIFDSEEFPLTEAELLENPDEPRYEIKFSLEETGASDDTSTSAMTMSFLFETAILSNGRDGSDFFLEPDLELVDATFAVPYSRLHIKNYGIAGGDLNTTAYADDLVGPFRPFNLRDKCFDLGDCDGDDVIRRTNKLKIFIREFVLTEDEITDPLDDSIVLGVSRSGTVTGSFRMVFKNARKMRTSRFNVLREKFGLIGEKKFKRKIRSESSRYGRVVVTCRFTDLPYSENITVIE